MSDGDTTLLVLDSVLNAHAKLRTTSEEEASSRPDDPTWNAVAAAALDGFLRGWVEEAWFWTDSKGKPQLTWRLTDRGERAIRAWRRRSGLS